MAEVEANLCYKSGTGSNAGKLTYSKGSGQLVFKSDVAYLTVVVSWSSTDKDLNICGYLEGLPDVKGGWSWPYCDRTYKDDKYFFRHYGDNTSYGGSEKFLIRLFPWSDMSLSHRLRIYLNYFGSSTTHVCTVTASTLSGQSISKSNIPCGIRYGNRAEPSLDPYVTIDIDENGAATSIEAHLPGVITGSVCFTATEANSSVGLVSTKTIYTDEGESSEQIPVSVSLQISYDEISWTDWSGEIITLANVGDKVYVKAGTQNDCFSYTEYVESNTILIDHNFVMTGKIAASGNIMFLLDPTGNSTTIPNIVTENRSTNGFAVLFLNCASLVQAPELPATTLADSCYGAMFSGCTSLTTAPALPATVLAEGCYASMFMNCTSLVQAPELPATTLADSCYGAMFSGCTSLTTAPALPATVLADFCYTYMFGDCTSITNVSILPATILAIQCYAGMFNGCTSLVQAPTLPATTLVEECYMIMFLNCTSLTTAPALPATTLTEGCYCFMFEGCTSLVQAPTLPATTLADHCYTSMFSGCTALKTPPTLPATTLADSCYSLIFLSCVSLSTTPELPATTLAKSCYNRLFEGCTLLNTIPILSATTLAEGCYSHLIFNDTRITDVYMPNIAENDYNVSTHGLLADHSIKIHFKN